ncbi:hypothetical protein J6590_107138, partial [Homalodisca vitripennis]
VLATNGPCADESGDTCVKSLTVLYLDHTVHLSSTGTEQMRRLNRYADETDSRYKDEIPQQLSR